MARALSELTLRAVLTELPQALAFAADVCAQAALVSADCFDVQLAVEEAFTNIVEHACRAGGGPVTLRAALDDDALTLTLSDRGRPFDPRTVARPNLSLPLDQRPLGGLGLHLIERLMDEVYFTRAEGWNTVALVKHLASARSLAHPRGEGAHG